MKKYIVIALMFAAIVMGTANATEIASVDIQKVVSASAQVKALKQEQENKREEFMLFLQKAHKEIAKIDDAEKKQQLAEKYDKEFAAMKQKQETDYTTKLKSIETSILNLVAKEAQAKGYDLVIPKGMVLYGGKDITDDIINALPNLATTVSPKSKKSR